MAQTDFAQSLVCDSCTAAVPIIDPTPGVRVLCPVCGIPQEITDDDGLRAHTDGLQFSPPPAALAATTPPATKAPTAGAAITTMRGRAGANPPSAASAFVSGSASNTSGLFRGNASSSSGSHDAYAGPTVNSSSDSGDTRFAAAMPGVPMRRGGPSAFAPAVPSAPVPPIPAGTVWKTRLIASAQVELDARGRRFAILTTIPYALGAVVIAVMLFAMSAMMATSAATGASFPTDDPDVPDMSGMGMMGMAVAQMAGGIALGILAHALVCLGAAIFARGLIRGVLLLVVGLVPMFLLILSGGYMVIYSTHALIASMLLPAVVVLYGAGAASHDLTDVGWIVGTAAVTGMLMIGIMLYIAFTITDALTGTFLAVQLSATIMYLIAILGLPPALAAWNYLKQSDTIARAVPVSMWVCYVGLSVVFTFITNGLQAAIGTFLVLSALFGWLFVAGAGLRDVLVHQALKMRATHASARGMAAPGSFAPAGSSYGAPPPYPPPSAAPMAPPPLPLPPLAPPPSSALSSSDDDVPTPPWAR